LLEVLVPFLAEHSKDKGENTNYHFGHIEERLGLMTIIVLGESILAIVYTFEKVVEHFSSDLISLAIGSVLILFSMWWIYFDDTVEDELASQKKAFIWAYGHFFIYVFATAVGVLISVNVDVLTHSAKIDEYIAINGLALAIIGYLVSVWLCHDYLVEKKGIMLYELLILAVSVLVIALFFQSILLIGVAFASINIIRVTMRHKACLLER